MVSLLKSEKHRFPNRLGIALLIFHTKVSKAIGLEEKIYV